MTLVNFRHFQENAVSRRRYTPPLKRSGLRAIATGPTLTPSFRHGGSGEQPIQIGRPGNDRTTGAAMARPSSQLQQQVEDLERTLPMARLWVLEVRIDDLERKRHAQSAAPGVKLGLGLLAEIQIKLGGWR
jgi:hypothetical protein